MNENFEISQDFPFVKFVAVFKTASGITETPFGVSRYVFLILLDKMVICSVGTDISGAAKIAKTGNVNDLIQTAGDILVFDCGSSSKNI